MKRLYTTFASPAIAMAALTVLGQPAPTNTQPAVAQDTPAVSIQGSDLKISGLPPVSFHGFASQGFLASDTYNYLGLSKSGSARFMEYGLNASVNPLPRTRITAQGFGYTVGPTGDYEPGLDYALAEYSFCDEIGVRGGRVRRQEGIYNNIVDLDLTRTSILLPQGMYPAEWRDMYSTIDGGDIFGNIPLSKAGSLEYELYSGLQRPSMKGGLVALYNARGSADVTSVNSPWMNGGQLWWKTPLKGMRLGAALNYDKDITYYDATGVKTVGSPYVQHYSIDYTWRDWTFQSEYFTYKIDYARTQNGAPALHGPASVHVEPDSWYIGASRRVNNWFETGAYYTEFYADVHQRSGGPNQYQRDLALSFRFDPTSWLILKVEGHMIQGTGNLNNGAARSDTISANPVRDERWWPMIALKATMYF